MILMSAKGMPLQLCRLDVLLLSARQRVQGISATSLSLENVWTNRPGIWLRRWLSGVASTFLSQNKTYGFLAAQSWQCIFFALTCTASSIKTPNRIPRRSADMEPQLSTNLSIGESVASLWILLEDSTVRIQIFANQNIPHTMWSCWNFLHSRLHVAYLACDPIFFRAEFIDGDCARVPHFKWCRNTEYSWRYNTNKSKIGEKRGCYVCFWK